MEPIVNNGIKYWYNKDGKLHRENGPAIEYPNGDKEWYKDGKKHRLNGPAIETKNYTEYYIEGNLHRDGGPSVTYHQGDEKGNGVGQTLYHLNGVSVPKYIAEAKEEDFDRNWFLKEVNAEIRREIIRKFGMERIFKLVDKKTLKIGEGNVLDKEKDYELLNIRLTKKTYGKYLKMKNPSVGVWHLEGVDPKCNTVQEALTWRNGGLENRPEILT